MGTNDIVRFPKVLRNAESFIVSCHRLLFVLVSHETFMSFDNRVAKARKRIFRYDISQKNVTLLVHDLRESSAPVLENVNILTFFWY